MKCHICPEKAERGACEECREFFCCNHIHECAENYGIGPFASGHKICVLCKAVVGWRESEDGG